MEKSYIDPYVSLEIILKKQCFTVSEVHSNFSQSMIGLPPTHGTEILENGVF